eukprot:scaffold302848_cov35-Tisochrysis_lutea.AAC.2
MITSKQLPMSLEKKRILYKELTARHVETTTTARQHGMRDDEKKRQDLLYFSSPARGRDERE